MEHEVKASLRNNSELMRSESKARVTPAGRDQRAAPHTKQSHGAPARSAPPAARRHSSISVIYSNGGVGGGGRAARGPAAAGLHCGHSPRCVLGAMRAGHCWWSSCRSFRGRGFLCKEAL